MPLATPDLLFESPPQAGSPTNLVFGAELVEVIPGATVDIAFALNSGVTVTAFLAKPVLADIYIALGGVTAAAAVFYDNRVTPYKDHRVTGFTQIAEHASGRVSTQWVEPVSVVGDPSVAWQPGQQAGVRSGISSETAKPVRNGSSERWRLGDARVAESGAVHQAAIRVTKSRSSGWQLARAIRADRASGMQAGIFKVLHSVMSHDKARPVALGMGGGVGASLHYAGVSFFTAPWQRAGAPRNGRSDVIDPVLPPTWWWGTDLLFECPPLAAPALVFGAQACYVDVPIGLHFSILPARFYMTTHNVFAQRLPDLASVPLYDASVSADEGSYCWTLQLSGPASLFDLLAPVAGLPARIRVTMDGIPFVFAVDGMQRTSAFGKTGVSLTGRSVTALIGAPYMRAVARGNAAADRMAQQLALDALEYSGVGLDWGLTDWLVPAGAWSQQGTPLEAVQAIARAAGGYLQSHRSAATLLARHPYSQRAGDNPGAPWGWMTGPADVDLAPDAIITDGVERRDGSDINAVYVSGTSQGVLANVKRAGTAGDKLSAMVTDALITHADAARQRGLAVLGAAGAQYNVSLELPVLTGAGEPGVLDVGQLVQVNTATPWRGRVRAVRAGYKRPSLRQTVTLERHLETA